MGERSGRARRADWARRIAGAVLLPLVVAAGPAVAARTDVVIGQALEPPHLDPTAGAAAAIDEVVYANVFEGLTRIDREGRVVPGLAESWTVSDDGLVYTFDLREGVVFHDGTPFDAEDAKFSLDRARGEGSTNAQKKLFEPIDTVEVVDPSTLRVTLSRSTGSFLFNLGWGDAVMVAPESAEGNKAQPVGTGPFAFGEWRRGDRLTLVRNPDYWGEAPALERVTFQFVSDPTAALSALLAGDVDAFPNFPAPESLAQLDADPRFEVVVGTTEGETILAMNSAREPLADVRVRRAIAHAIDRQAIVDGAMFGYGTPIGSHVAPHSPDYVDLTGVYPHDPETARALLAEAGHAGGLSLSLKLPPPAYARRGGEILAAQLRDVGIETEIVPLEWAQWLEEVFKNKDYDLTIVSHTEPQDIDIYGRPDYYFHVADPALQDTLAALAVENDPERRGALLADAQERIAELSVNGFLFQLAKLGVWRSGLEGMWTNSPIQANDLTGVSWSE